MRTSESEEARILRERVEAAMRRLDAVPDRLSLRAQSRVGVVYSAGAIPTTADKYYALHPAKIYCGSAEGVGATPDNDTGSTILSDVLGGEAAPGDYVIARNVAYRWAAQHLAATTPGISCDALCTGVTIPSTLTMTDSMYGVAVTLTWDLYTSRWLGCGDYSFTAYGSGGTYCAAVNGSVKWTLRCISPAQFFGFMAAWTPPGNNVGSNCPKPLTCEDPDPNSSYSQQIGSALNSLSCSPFHAVFHSTWGGVGYPFYGATFTITE